MVCFLSFTHTVQPFRQLFVCVCFRRLNDLNSFCSTKWWLFCLLVFVLFSYVKRFLFCVALAVLELALFACLCLPNAEIKERHKIVFLMYGSWFMELFLPMRKCR